LEICYIGYYFMLTDIMTTGIAVSKVLLPFEISDRREFINIPTGLEEIAPRGIIALPVMIA
jgi:hypothetical protein